MSLGGIRVEMWVLWVYGGYYWINRANLCQFVPGVGRKGRVSHQAIRSCKGKVTWK